MTDTIRAIWAKVEDYPCSVGPNEYTDIAAQRAVLGRLVDAYQDAGDEARGLFLARLLGFQPRLRIGYHFHLWRDSDDPGPRCWKATGLEQFLGVVGLDALVAAQPWLESPETCFEHLFEKLPH